MAKIRALLKDARVERAARKRKCHRKQKHSILAGEPCLVVRDPTTGASRNYCIDCAQPILGKAHDDLHELHSALYSNARTRRGGDTRTP